MERNNFVHLHVHSEYSLLDGATRINKLIEKVSYFGMPAVALTDHGVMYGAIDFYSTATNAGIKPIIGCETYLAPKSRWNKQSERDSKEENFYHLTLLAENEEGYKNLMKLTSLGFIEGFYYKPRIDKELLQNHHNGIIALSGCIAGEIPRFIIANKIKKARLILEEYVDIFGKDNFFLELQDSGIPEQKHVNKVLAEFSTEFSMPLVATNDVHYLNKEDSKSHDVLLCIQTGSTINETGRLRFPNDQYYLKNYKEMQEIFKDYPDALENTMQISDRCNLKLNFGLNLIPKFQVPEQDTPDEYLKKLCYEGVKTRYENINGEITERIEKEIEVIRKMGFSEYFLIVWDFVRYAKKNNIRVGPGRGSAAGSIVSYLLGITDIEPLRYGLLFERFLNEARASMPDIDIDFCYEKRDKVIKYVTEKYGEGRVAQLITFGTMAARQAIRDAGRVLEIPYAEVDRIAKLIPMELNVTIGGSLKMVSELRGIYKNDARFKEVIDTAISLEGIIRQDSIHAAGVVISSENLYNYTPIQKEGGSDIVTQYKMEDVQKIGLLKMDFLGLKTLSLIDKTLFLIKKTKNLEIDINNVQLDDEKTFRMLTEGECLGVFQLESSGMRELVMNLKPSNFEDLIALLALYRPGPLQSGMVSDFVESKNGRKKIEYFHHSLKPILESTYGIILYQEQVMGIASRLAGFSMSEADILRGAISKKKRRLLSEQRNKFIEGAKKNGISEDISTKIFELVNHFAEYGFNKSHSTAYAMISYQTAYLKANFPVEFMAALLSIRMGSQEKVAQYVNETRRMNIVVLPPDVNESFSDFTVVGSSIRFGLSAIKNVGANVIESIEKERKEKGKFNDFIDFCERVDNSVLNKKTIESLIMSGTFDTLGYSRKYLLNNYEKIVEEVLKVKRDRENGQYSLFDTGVKAENKILLNSIPDKDFKTDEFTKKKLLNFEKDMLGLYISGHPILEYESALSNYSQINELIGYKDKDPVQMGGIITKVKNIFTKKDQQMSFIEIEDLNDSIEVIVFPNVLEKYKELIREDRVVIIKGRLDKKEDQIKILASDFFEPNKSGEAQSRNNSETGLPESKPMDDQIVLEIKEADFSNSLVNELYELINKHEGESRVMVKIVSNDGRDIIRNYELPPNFGVQKGSNIFSELNDKFPGKISWT